MVFKTLLCSFILNPHFFNEFKKSDCFLSWNHSDKEKVFQIAPRFYTKKIDQKNINKGDKIYIILAGNHLYNFIAQYALLKVVKLLIPIIVLKS